MKTPFRLPARAAAAALAALIAAPQALAQTSLGEPGESGLGASADITGAWTFETKIFDQICKMTGDLVLEPGENPGEYVGDLTAHQRCGLPDIGYEDWRAVQTVQAVRDGDRLTITSTIISVTPQTELYFPDDFDLEIVDGALMPGQLRSITVVPAVFYRGDAPIA
ncbi:MAG: hypothetical protein PVI23_14610 [Maricaulaceae bacterium]|jgi:hypothetical protein